LGRIQVLSDALIDRIAAGEVVERPASVVKELVENSLDAGATSVTVRLEGGGRQRIRVEDDGCGMDRDDALLALERHATSKLSQAADLESIATLGFRGEALSSIAAVSRFTLRTARAAGTGTEIEVHGGRIQAVREIGMPQGTTVQVDRLFHNVPARRKFLRTVSTELSHALRWLTRYALGCPDRRFQLQHGERRLLDVPANSGPLERIAAIYGRDLADRLLPFGGTGHGMTLSGHAGRGRFPALFLFLEMDPAEVDVNVHPQKTEVRFRRTSLVHDVVRDTLHGALAQTVAVPSLSELRPDSIGGKLSAVRESALRYLETREPATAAPGRAGSGLPARARVEIPRAPEERSGRPTTGSLLDDREPTPGGEGRREAVPLAQFRDSYIVAEDAQGLMLVDQHAAHERVLFERYLEDAEENRVEVQQLLFPVTVELAPHERVLVEEETDEFRRLGFRIEPFGGDTVRLDAIPAVAGDVDAAFLFRELVGEAATVRSAASGVDVLRRKLITTAACHAAIKVNHPLTAPAMQGLLDDLHGTANPTTCPHGRPALFRLTVDEIERAFRRR